MSVTMRIVYKLKLKKDGKIIKNSFKNDSLFCFMADLESNGQIEDEEKAYKVFGEEFKSYILQMTTNKVDINY